MKELYEGEVGEVWKVPYALIDYGDGIRCAWCNKKDPSYLHLTIHDKIQKFKNLFK